MRKRNRWINRLPGYIVSIALISMIVLIAFTVTASIIRVLPVSRSIAPWRLRHRHAHGLHPVFARSPFHPCQHADDVLGTRWCTHAFTHDRLADGIGLRDTGQLLIEHAGEGEQIVALVLQRHAHRTKTSHILGFATHQFLDDEVEQRSPASLGPARPVPRRRGSTTG
jgi:hypothetical protein